MIADADFAVHDVDVAAVAHEILLSGAGALRVADVFRVRCPCVARDRVAAVGASGRRLDHHDRSMKHTACSVKSKTQSIRHAVHGSIAAWMSERWMSERWCPRPCGCWRLADGLAQRRRSGQTRSATGRRKAGSAALEPSGPARHEPPRGHPAHGAESRLRQRIPRAEARGSHDAGRTGARGASAEAQAKGGGAIMRVPVGRCSLCGGTVMHETGPLWTVGPWPEDRCASCGAVRRRPTVEMEPGPRRIGWKRS